MLSERWRLGPLPSIFRRRVMEVWKIRTQWQGCAGTAESEGDECNARVMLPLPATISCDDDLR